MGSSSSTNTAQRQADNAKRAKNIDGFATFTQKQRQALLQRYRNCNTFGQQGLPVEVCLAMPEFVDNKILSVLIYDFVNSGSGRITEQDFLQFCSFLSANTSPAEKKRTLFESFDVYKSQVFTHDEIFRLYKVLLNHTVSDDYILALTVKTLEHPSLSQKGQMTKAEFMKMIPDSEIEEKLTVYFNIPA